MATLQRITPDPRETRFVSRAVLSSEHTIGRSSSCRLRMRDARVSGHHALIRWTGTSWEIRDLGSRNGTFVSGHKLAPGQPRVLEADDQVAFGRESHLWRVVDVDPPVAMARDDQGNWQLADDGLLLLPDAEQPELCIYQSDQGWVCEQAHQTTPVEDGDSLQVTDRSFELSLPHTPEATRDVGHGVIDLHNAHLTLAVSLDEEHVEMRLQSGDAQLVLPHRSHLYLVLTLARARLRDQDTPHLAESEHGWEYQDDLERQLRIKPNQFNVVLFRARRQLKKAGVLHADTLVQRRRGSGQLRLGVGALTVGAL